MPLPENFNLMRLFRGEYPEASITVHLFTNELQDGMRLSVDTLLEPDVRGYQPVACPLPAPYQVDDKTFAFGHPRARFSAFDLEEDVTIVGVFFALHWLEEKFLLNLSEFAQRPVFRKPQTTIEVNASGVYLKTLDDVSVPS